MISTQGSPQTKDDVVPNPADGVEAAVAHPEESTGPVEPTGSAEAGDAAPASGATAVDEPKGRRRVGVLLAVAVLAFLIDLGSKLLVVAKLENHAAIKVIGDVVTLQVIRNSGAAFGMGQALTVVFTMIAAAVIVVIWRIARRLYSLPWAIALGLLLGGALGNLTDRLFRAPGVFRGHVVDFISVQHFAVFNLADSAIVCGGILVVLLSFRGSNPDGSVHQQVEKGEK
ncbi:MULTISPECIES: signal peptidase II [Kitasatospora]|uniref:Lipoprotein signal peptidase n=1 Tax=Kitasatospora cathayae TaxID=3004092 RepID=A0ABY7QHE9_9ACTN|nr:signal peptidase II [Kitasatospora sp. HUAS 3-15]WBP91780.1 signal peptidase II [Kitasatospora sp. HUAS 3-15]